MTGHLTKNKTKSKIHYHNLCNLLWVIAIKIKLEGHHLPVMGFQLALCYSVSHIRNLQRFRLKLFNDKSVTSRINGKQGQILTLRTFSLALVVLSWRERLRTDRRWWRFMERPSWRPPDVEFPSLPSLRPEAASDRQLKEKQIKYWASCLTFLKVFFFFWGGGESNNMNHLAFLQMVVPGQKALLAAPLVLTEE